MAEHTPIANLRRYVENRTAQPLLGLGDSVHRIHLGDEREAEITFSDLIAVLHAHDDLVKALELARKRIEFFDRQADETTFFPVIDAALTKAKQP